MGLFAAADRQGLLSRINMAITNDENLKHALADLIDKFDSLTALTASLTGNVTGNLTGDVSGSVVGGRMTLGVSTPSVDGIADMTKSLFLLGTGIDLTTFTPAAAGQVAVVWCTDSTADVTVKCGAGCTFDGTNNTATFADTGDGLVLIAQSVTRWLILVNIGAVTFSST